MFKHDNDAGSRYLDSFSVRTRGKIRIQVCVILAIFRKSAVCQRVGMQMWNLKKNCHGLPLLFILFFESMSLKLQEAEFI